jgi:hypothetical protein
MLEIFVLIRLGRSIAAKATDKGRSGVPYVFMLLGFWFGGEFVGAFGGAILSLLLDEGREPNMFLIYAGALTCAILGAVIAFQIVAALGDRSRSYDSDHQDYGEYSDLPRYQE